jgi:3-oxoacyl-[acyl-carrier-protein] synthase-3
VSDGRLALVLGGDRLTRMLDYTDPESWSLVNFGDAGTAVVVGARDYSFRLLHTAMRTDPTWCDYYDGCYHEEGVTIRRNGFRPGLGKIFLDNFVGLVHETLRTIGREVHDIAHFLFHHGDRGLHERVLATLGLPAARSVFNYDRLGHMGGADPLIALRDLQTQGRLRRGDLILTATAAMGFTWGVTALEATRGTDTRLYKNMAID